MSQTPQATTLQGIAAKTHAIAERIKVLKAEGNKIQKLFDQMPTDPASRVAWLKTHLSNT